MKTPLLTISLALCALALPSAVFAETVTAEPDAFLEYVEADGNQYIDTGVNAETGLKARLDFEWSAKVASNDDWSLLDAATTANASDNRSRVFLCHLYNQKPFFGYGLKERGNPSGTTEYARERRYEILTDIADTNSLELAQNGKKTFSAGDRSLRRGGWDCCCAASAFRAGTDCGRRRFGRGRRPPRRSAPERC